mmetsp:Transcript_18011/g.51147  ORF Transcript_18011/g.51147 Transcript_18011/m.51147 type:complete len:330 (-) Transcript_18011:812-1801(-)
MIAQVSSGHSRSITPPCWADSSTWKRSRCMGWWLSSSMALLSWRLTPLIGRPFRRHLSDSHWNVEADEATATTTTTTVEPRDTSITFLPGSTINHHLTTLSRECRLWPRRCRECLLVLVLPVFMLMLKVRMFTPLAPHRRHHSRQRISPPQLFCRRQQRRRPRDLRVPSPLPRLSMIVALNVSARLVRLFHGDNGHHRPLNDKDIVRTTIAPQRFMIIMSLSRRAEKRRRITRSQLNTKEAENGRSGRPSRRAGPRTTAMASPPPLHHARRTSVARRGRERLSTSSTPTSTMSCSAGARSTTIWATSRTASSSDRCTGSTRAPKCAAPR